MASKLKPTPSNPDKRTKREFDINEIKSFKFKTGTKDAGKRAQTPKIASSQLNPWDNLMDEIRKNPCTNLKKTDNKSSNKQRRNTEYNSSKLLRDLNLILSQRKIFFDDNDDKDDDSCEECWD